MTTRPTPAEVAKAAVALLDLLAAFPLRSGAVSAYLGGLDMVDRDGLARWATDWDDAEHYLAELTAAGLIEPDEPSEPWEPFKWRYIDWPGRGWIQSDPEPARTPQEDDR